MAIRLAPEELAQVNDLIRRDPAKYVEITGITPPQQYFDRVEGDLRADVGQRLASKVVSNPHFRKLGMRSVYEGLYDFLADQPPENVSADKMRNRFDKLYNDEGILDRGGVIYYIKIGSKIFLIKAYQTPKLEKEAIEVASEIGVGPRIFGPGVEIVEEYLGDQRLPSQKTTREIGIMVGSLLRRCHDVNLIYGDGIPRHLRYGTESGLRLIDFGTSFVDDGQRPLDERTLTALIINDVNRTTDRTPYLTISREALKQKELEKLVAESPFIRKSGFATSLVSLMCLKDKSTKELADSVLEGYSTPTIQ